MLSQKNLRPASTSPWILLPLRLFLGITFIYAGMQKLTDPQFFRPTAAGYIGKQIAAFAKTSPLQSFLLHFVLPHATLFGYMVAYGEIAIGLGTLLGLLLRPAAFFGLLLNILFFLSATWRVSPYFYGSDMVFAFCWLTLLLSGPLNTGLPTLDAFLTRALIRYSSPIRQARLANIFDFFLGTVNPPIHTTSINLPIQSSPNRPGIVQQRSSSMQHHYDTRRNFLLGAITGGISVASLAIFTYIIGIFNHQVSRNNGTNDILSTQTPPQSAITVGPNTPTSPLAIAQVNAVPVNSAVGFTIPSIGDPGVLVRLKNGQFVAYDALCTHAGCQVDYDSGSQLLICPCHGAAFDPAQGGAAIELPASLPLSPVSIRIDSATGAITLN